MKYIDADKLIKAIEEKGLDCSFVLKMERLDTLALIDELQQEQREELVSDDLEGVAKKYADLNCHNHVENETDWNGLLYAFKSGAEWMAKQLPLPEDTVAFQKGVQEGRRLEREDALTIADIEKLHTFLYAVKNNKQGAFTFTRLTDEQYEEVLRRFNNAKEK